MGTLEEFFSFIDRVDSLGEFEPLSMKWRAARRDGQALRLEVFVETHSQEIPDQSWEIRVGHAREIVLSKGALGEHDDLTLYHDHVLLWGHTESVSQLCFTGPSGNHESLLWDLYERHRQLAREWVPFDRYLNGTFIWNRLSGGHGVLAEGPDRLLREYAEVLRGSDLAPYFPQRGRAATDRMSKNGVLPSEWGYHQSRFGGERHGITVAISSPSLPT